MTLFIKYDAPEVNEVLDNALYEALVEQGYEFVSCDYDLETHTREMEYEKR